MNSNDEALGQSESTIQAADAAQVSTDLGETVIHSEESLAQAPREEKDKAANHTSEDLPVEEAPADVIVESPADEELFLAALEGGAVGEGSMDDFVFAPLKRGQIIKGVIASISENEILVDIGTKSEGVISGQELERLDQETKKSLKVGDQVYAYVLTPEDRNGYPQLSLRRAIEEQDWREAEEYLADKRVYHSRIAGYNKGGLIVRFGKVRGFVPASQISRERRLNSEALTPEERWGALVGEEIMVKVIEVDRRRNRLILSERAADKEIRAQRRTKLLESLEVGQVHTGQVISLADFGAFVDLGGADGLIHLSELSWKHVTHPKEVLKVGDQVEVEVINIDRERQRIALSRRKCLEDPWSVLARTHRRGQLVQGRITKLTKFGAFAQLVEFPEIEGLIHISELSEQRVEHPREVVEEGQIITLRIIRVDTERRRLGLSLRRVDMEEYLDEDWQDVVAAVNEDVVPDEGTDHREAEQGSEAL